MKLTRRNTLVGLGAVVAGSGALVGSGAFSSVEADRTVTINTAGDGQALLQLDVEDSYSGITDGSPTGTQGESIIELTLDDINDDAVTTFDGALTITNGGSNPVDLSIDTSDVDGVTFTLNDTNLNAAGSTTVDLEVDTRGTVSDGDITITATDSS